MAATELAAPDRGRAETYLRLQAEAELRRALAMPEYKPPRARRRANIVCAAQAHLMRRRRAMTHRIVRRQGTGAGPARNQSRHANQSKVAQATAALQVIRRAPKWLDVARRAAAAPTAAVVKSAARTSPQLSARMQSAAWQRRRRFRRGLRHRGYKAPPAEACLTRLEHVAGVFAAVGAITAQTEEEIVGGLRAALAARSRIEQDALLGYHSFSGHALVGYSRLFGGHPMRRIASGTAASSGPPRAIPVGASATGEIEGVRVRFYLGVLVFDHSVATLTVHARFPVELLDDNDGDMHPVYEALNEIRAVDDRGATYQADFNGGGYGECDGQLHLSPAPSPEVRWLDMTLPGAPAVRVRLDSAPRDLQITTEQVTTSAADRFLDAQTIHVLRCELTDRDGESDDDDRDLADDGCDLLPLLRAASHLVAAGVLTSDTPSLRRLAAAAARLDTPLPEPLAAIEPSDLPADWLSQLSRADCTDGPTAAIPIAAVLPEVGGVQCVIVELVSDSESATLQVHARGRPEPQPAVGVHSNQIWWSARDDLGGGYLVGEDGSSYCNGESDLELEISPAINPQARVLDITLTGATTQVTVTVPLDWQEAL
jgi:hypothetical protein